ncbi:MAG: hypothetical protein ABSH31_15330, partial [Bryobacteraceae bacterium]
MPDSKCTPMRARGSFSRFGAAASNLSAPEPRRDNFYRCTSSIVLLKFLRSEDAHEFHVYHDPIDTTMSLSKMPDSETGAHHGLGETTMTFNFNPFSSA